MYSLKEMSLSVELFLSCSILQLTFYAIGTAYQRNNGFIILSQQIYNIGFLIVGLATLLILNEDLLISNSLSSNNFIINDYLSFTSKLTICLISALFLFIIKISYKDELIHNNFEYIVLIIISILGLLLLCSSNDLITAYLAIELQSVAFYLMAAFKKNSSYSIESGLKYFIIGALSSAFFLFGSVIIYGCLGSLNFDDFKIFISLLSSCLSSDILINLLIPLYITSISFLDFLMSFELRLIHMSQYMNFRDLDFSAKVYDVIPDETLDWFIEKNGADLIQQISLSDGFSQINILEGSMKNLVFNETYEMILWEYNIFMSEKHFNSGWNSCDILYENIMQSRHFNSNLWLNDSIWTVLIHLNIFETSENLILIQNILNYHLISLSNGDHIMNGSMLDLNLVYIGFMLLCVSIFIKLALAPFHLWSLDVYEGSPNSTTVFFAVIPKIGLFVLLFRLCYSSFYAGFISNWQIYFFIFAILSIFVGAIGGLEQRKLKSLLAYSSVSHTGYLLLSFSTGTVEGMQMMLYYLAIFMISGLCFWSVYLFIRQKRSFYFRKHNKELGDLVLLREANPMLALILAITLFSIAGIPPIVGFLAKIGIFLVVIQSSAYLISLISILFSIASTFYYIRVIKVLYFENILVGKLYYPISTNKSLLVAILALFLIILCIDPTILYLLFYKASLLANY